MSSLNEIAAVMQRTLSDEDEARIFSMKNNHWIGYDSALSIRKQMSDLLKHPRNDRMPNLALTAETNNGKTMLLKNFCKQHNPPVDINSEKTILPVLMVQTPPAANEGRLYFAILERLFAAGSPREHEDSKITRLSILLDHLETKVLILDDFLNIGSSTPSRRLKFLNALRNLSIRLEIPIIVAGLPGTLNILSIDPSIANRFKPVTLPLWSAERLEEFARFVLSMEQTLMLKNKCDLMDEESLNRLLIFSEGLIGETVALLRLLAEWAIRSGAESFSVDMITRDTLKSLGWVIPSDRSRHRA
jgi:hypothetical protein